MKIKDKIVVGYRVAASLLVLAAIVVQFYSSTQRPVFSPVNFFSFFTIQSNIFAALVLLFGAFYMLKGKELPKKYDLIRGAAVLYMSITGLVVFFILSRVDADLQLTMQWVDTVVHEVMPLVMVFDWIVSPPAKRLAFGQIKWWLIYPIAYLFYSLIRGPIVDWYPYPFLNPDKVGGYGGIALYALGISVGAIAMSCLVVWLSNKLRKLEK